MEKQAKEAAYKLETQWKACLDSQAKCLALEKANKEMKNQVNDLKHKTSESHIKTTAKRPSLLQGVGTNSELGFRPSVTFDDEKTPHSPFMDKSDVLLTQMINADFVGGGEIKRSFTMTDKSRVESQSGLGKKSGSKGNREFSTPKGGVDKSGFISPNLGSHVKKE